MLYSLISLNEWHGLSGKLSFLKAHVILLHLSINHLKTNQSRELVQDERFAKFRANMAYCFGIYDLETNKTRDHVLNSFWCRNQIIYHEYKWILPDRYDRDVNVVCGAGIHYFNHVLAAFCYFPDCTQMSSSDLLATVQLKHELERRIGIEGQKVNGFFIEFNEDGEIVRFILNDDVCETKFNWTAKSKRVLEKRLSIRNFVYDEIQTDI